MKLLALIFFYFAGLFFTNQEPETYCVIHFQNFFKKDLLSIYLGGCKIAQEVLVNSDSSSGLSNFGN